MGDVPMFIAEARYDSWQLGNILGDGFEFSPYRTQRNKKNCTQADVDKIAQYGRDMVMSIMDDKKENTGFYIASCYYHAGTVNEISRLGWRDVKVNGTTGQDTFRDWYFGRGSGQLL